MESKEIEMIKEAHSAAKDRCTMHSILNVRLTDADDCICPALTSTKYPIKADMQDSVRDLLMDYDLVPLEVYDRSKKLVPTKDLARILKGALVQVIFNLHYNFVSTQKMSNFRGQVVQVFVLKNTTRVSFSPRKKGPVKLQTAVLRADQVEAVKKFLLPKLLPREGSVTADEELGTKKHEASEDGSSSEQSASRDSTRGGHTKREASSSQVSNPLPNRMPRLTCVTV